jgi:predicted AAA+ superfamily ATPase
MLPELERHLNVRQASVITGIRRCGKTTLCKMLLDKIPSKNKLYIDLEKLSNRSDFEDTNYDNIILKLQKDYGLDFKSKVYLVLDEIQFIRNIPSVVKYLYDHYNIKFILTGSSSYYMKGLFRESLAGRKRIFELYTLSFGEFLRFKSQSAGNINFIEDKFFFSSYLRFSQYYEEFIRYGGFPEVVLAEDIHLKKEYLEDILDSYIKTDIKNFSDFENYAVIYKMLKVMASRAANKLEITNIANVVGVSKTTISNYLELLESSYFLKRVPVITKNPEREISKMPKLYLHDNGLLNALAEVGSGVQFENAIFNQLKHYGEINYYKLKTGREIDFILKLPSGPFRHSSKRIAFEVKEHCGDFDVKRLNRLSDNLKIPVRKLIFRYPPPKEGQMSEEYVWGGDIR